MYLDVLKVDHISAIVNRTYVYLPQIPQSTGCFYPPMITVLMPCLPYAWRNGSNFQGVFLLRDLCGLLFMADL